MANLFFAANTILTSKAARFGSKRIWLFTDDDDPGTKEAQKSVITRARDLNDLGIKIECRFFDKPGKPAFDRSKFYDNILYRDEEDEGDIDDWKVPLDPLARVGTLTSWMKSKRTPKRSQFNIPMELAPGMEIGIKGYILFKRQEIHRSHYVYAQGEKLEIAEVKSADIDPVSSTFNLTLTTGIE
jgi:ATP-dependent DNA helicase 2 subunit 1